MAFQLIVLCATLAAASAGIINAPGHLAYTGGPAVAHYSSAPSVSTVYSSIAQPQHLQYAAAPVAKVAYAAPSVTYGAPVTQYASAPTYTTYGSHDAHAIGASQESTIRSFGGSVSHFSKAVDTPYSSVRKSDTRVSNNVYAPALATKTVAYAAQPAVYAQQAAVYSHAQPAVYAQAQPAVYAQQGAIYSNAQPAVYAHAQPTVYAHGAPTVVTGSKTISYGGPSVAHVQFAGLGTNYAW